MKGILLAGGTGSRLFPLTYAVSKHLLPVFDKPMIYYPLSVLMLAGIRDILIISKEKDILAYKALLKDGQHLGIRIRYAIQEVPRGVADAFLIGEEFIGDDSVALALGDNIFFGPGFSSILNRVKHKENRATVFGYRVKDPSRYGVINLDDDFTIHSIEEKPENPKSHYAVAGLYFYDNHVVKIAKGITPSDRGELEITSINQEYLESGHLEVELLGRGFYWVDAGTYESLLDASHFIETIEKKQGFKIACIEEVAYRMDYISKDQLVQLAVPLLHNDYGQYLMEISREVNKNLYIGV